MRLDPLTQGRAKAVALRIVQFLATMFTALALVPSGASCCPAEQDGNGAGSLLHHPAEPCWMGPLRHCPFGALRAILALTIMLRRLSRPFGYALAALPCRIYRGSRRARFSNC